MRMGPGIAIGFWMHPASFAAALAAMLSLFLANGLFSLLFAAVTQGLLPARLRRSAALNVATLTVFGSLLPGIGPILLLMLGLICPYLEKPPEQTRPKLLPRPAYAAGVADRVSAFGAGGALVKLRTAQPGSPHGARALLAIEVRRNQESMSLVRDALRHPDETLRLLAHNLLARREDAIVRHMSRLEERLASGQPRTRPRIALEIAELHLEFLYLGFAADSLKAMHLGAAWRLLDGLGEPPDSVPWYPRFKVLRARLRRQGGDAGDDTLIRRDCEQALAAGAPPARALPWLLEQAWEARDYTRIRELAAHRRLYAQVPLIGPVVARWAKQHP